MMRQLARTRQGPKAFQVASGYTVKCLLSVVNNGWQCRALWNDRVWLNDRSGMNREIHVPLREGLEVQFLRATRPPKQVAGLSFR
jgi:hypothetical protein